MNFKISIITVCYNCSKYVQTTIDSIVSQDYSNIEYIVIDGCSTDNSLSIFYSNSKYINFILSESDLGIYDAMNKGLALASGDVIGILNSDDFYPNPSVISDVVKAFKANPYTEMVLGNVDFIHPDSPARPLRFYSSFNFKPWKMRFGFMPAHPAAFIKRSAYEKVGDYKLGFKIAADFEWFVRAIMLHNVSFIKLNKSLVRMRMGGISTSGLKSNWIASKEMIFALQSNKVSSSILFVFVRLPFKWLKKIHFKLFKS